MNADNFRKTGKGRILRARVSEKDIEKLKKVMKTRKFLTMSDALRTLINDAYKSITGKDDV